LQLFFALALLAPMFHEFLQERASCAEARARAASEAAFQAVCNGGLPCRESDHHHHRHHKHDHCYTCQSYHQGGILPVSTQSCPAQAAPERRLSLRETFSPVAVSILTHPARAPPVLS
jgi:hypothetical protein